MLKLVALDIDGTLLNDQGEITDRTKRAISRLRGQGVEFTLCTGRNLPLARSFAEALQITLPIVTCNGAEIRRLDGEIHARKSLPLALTKQVYAILRKYDTLFDIYSNDRIVIKSKPAHLRRLIEYYHVIKPIDKQYDSKLQQEINQPYMFETQDLDVWMDSEYANVEKFFVMEHRQEQLKSMFNELLQLSEIMVTTSHLTTLEINHKIADKGSALAQLANIIGLKNQEIAAIGDGMNDVSMFRFAGISAAMGNASEAVQQQATFVTGPNSEEGLAQALERWVI